MMQKVLMAIAGAALTLSVGGIWWAGNTNARVDAHENQIGQLGTDLRTDLRDLREQLRDIQRFLLENVR